jgi:hypothetical protein
LREEAFDLESDLMDDYLQVQLLAAVLKFEMSWVCVLSPNCVLFCELCYSSTALAFLDFDSLVSFSDMYIRVHDQINRVLLEHSKNNGRAMPLKVSLSSYFHAQFVSTFFQ